MRNNSVGFEPRGVLANPHIQSILTSGPWRRRLMKSRARDYLISAEPEIVDAGDGVRLLGYRHRVKDDSSRKALVILLHGWEGSADSSYLVGMGQALRREGFDTFRLNFRDHGPSHHLNEEIFHSCRLREVLHAVTRVAGDDTGRPVFLVGFSLGGNFALRVARNASETGLKLTLTIAISPVVRPASVLESLEHGPFFYHHYFNRKWSRSLATKEKLFPERFDFSEWRRLKGLRARTEYLVEHFSEFPNLDAYLGGYSIEGDYLEGLEQPALIVTAADDPIIPVGEFKALPRIPALDMEITRGGGHCGFIENWRLRSWLERRIRNEICRMLSN